MSKFQLQFLLFLVLGFIITENLTCPVCYQLFKNPKFLPCYHSYCEECLEKMQVQYKITCPECRRKALVPVGGVKDLPNNFFINRMVDVLKCKMEGEEEVRCDECGIDEPLVGYCSECNMSLCQSCCESHNQSKGFHGHTVVPLNKPRFIKDVTFHPKVIAASDHNYDIAKSMAPVDLEKVTASIEEVKKDFPKVHDTIDEIEKVSTF